MQKKTSKGPSEMQHIAIYLPSLQGGGAERVMAVLANGFAERGHRIDLVLANAEGPYIRDISDAVRIVDLGNRRVLTSLGPLARYLRREKPDAILSALNHANIVAILAHMLARARCRLLVSERNSVSRMGANGTERIIRSLMRWLYPRADRIICVSRGIQDELVKDLGLPKHKLCTIYNPLVVDGIRRQSAPAPDHPWFGAGKPPVIIAVGRLTKQKDYPMLLRAFAHLRTSRDAKLVILGEGKDRSSLSESASRLGLLDDVDFVGYQENPFPWMAAAQLYVMSSAWEGLPGALLQAMACGTPVVSTDCPSGPSEILEDGRWGRLVDVGDDIGLARAMAATLDDRAPPQVRDRADAFRVEYALDNYIEAIGARPVNMASSAKQFRGNETA